MVPYFYLKFCEKEQYAHDFVAGKLYMNSLAYFKKLEQPHLNDDGRGDRFEGPSSWLQPGALGEIRIGNVRISPVDLDGPVVVQHDRWDALNILCLYAATAGSFDTISADNLEAFRQDMRIPDRCLAMGAHAVMVCNVGAFQDRLAAAAKREHFELQSKLVQYFDPDRFSGNIQDPIFLKRQDFSWQREYRFALDRNVSTPDPYVLDAGSLGGICTIVDTATINQKLTVRLPA